MKSIIIKIVLPAVLCLSTISCKDTFDIEPEDVLSSDLVYRNISDADAAVFGVYGKFMKLADRYVILNELRADLLDATSNTNFSLNEINTHNVSAANPYADPKIFYEVILNCNDVLKNLDRMLAEGKLNQIERDERYSDIGALRSWVYLQLGIHYGEVPYIVEPIENINDLGNESLYPKISFDELLNKLITFTSALPNLGQYQSGSTTRITADGVNLEQIFIYRRFILADLYLWRNDYLEAAKVYKLILDAPNTNAPVDNRRHWRISYSSYDGSRWPQMFTDVQSSGAGETALGGYRQEWIWGIPFKSGFEPEFPFINLFSNNGGSYQMKPSTLAINNWLSQTRNDGSPGDLRGRNGSWAMQSGQPVVTKFLGFFSPATPLKKEGIWYLNRAAQLHLRYSEAANRDNKHRLAWALLNYDLKHVFDPHQGPLFYNENHPGKSFTTDWPGLGAGARRNASNIQKTPWEFPYNLSGQEFDVPTTIRGPYSNHIAIRGRVGLEVIRIDSAKYFDMDPSFDRFINSETLLRERPFLSQAAQDSLIEDMEDDLIKESALELAFEGHRWADLLRIARRRNDPAFLAKKVAAKFRAAGNNATADAVEQKLLNPAHWYLPFNIKK